MNANFDKLTVMAHPWELPSAPPLPSTRFERFQVKKNVWRARVAAIAAVVVPALAASVIMLLVVGRGAVPLPEREPALMVAAPAVVQARAPLAAAKLAKRAV